MVWQATGLVHARCFVLGAGMGGTVGRTHLCRRHKCATALRDDVNARVYRRRPSRKRSSNRGVTKLYRGKALHTTTEGGRCNRRAMQGWSLKARRGKSVRKSWRSMRRGMPGLVDRPRAFAASHAPCLPCQRRSRPSCDFVAYWHLERARHPLRGAEAVA